MPRSHLLAPLDLGPLRLRTRVLLSPMTTGFGFDRGAPTEELLAYFRARCGGVGMAVVAFGAVAPEGRVEDAIPWMWRDEAAAVLAPLASAIAQRGALPCLQLGHGGRQVSPRVTGTAPVAPSAIAPAVHVDVPPRALTTAEAEDVVAAFGDAAAKAAGAGFEAVEVHAGHGYLIQQFLAPDSNRRDDRFGGATTAERARFGIEVVRAVRAATQGAVLVRLNGDDLVPGGLTRGDAAVFAELVAAAGADAIVVSSGVYGSVPYSIPLLDDPEATFLDAAAHVRRRVGVPVIAVGRFTRPAAADAAIARGDCDAVAVGRALLADPRWVEKAAAGEDPAIRPCIATVQGCAGMLQHGDPISCSVNPDVGREARPPTPSGAPRSVLVVGGGVAGMEAARRAAELGHEVLLLERESQPGGLARLAAGAPALGALHRLVAWYAWALQRAGVEVRCGVDATGDSLPAADVVVVAVGARSEVPAVDGYEHLPAWPLEDLLAGRPSSLETTALPATAVVAGGDQRALAGALWLAHRGSEVTVLAPGRLGEGTSGLARRALLTRMERLGVAVVRDRLAGLAPGAVLGRDGACLPADGVVLAERTRPERLPGLDRLAGHVAVVGDARQPRDIATAIAEGRDTIDALATAGRSSDHGALRGL